MNVLANATIAIKEILVNVCYLILWQGYGLI